MMSRDRRFKEQKETGREEGKRQKGRMFQRYNVEIKEWKICSVRKVNEKVPDHPPPLKKKGLSCES